MVIDSRLGWQKLRDSRKLGFRGGFLPPESGKATQRWLGKGGNAGGIESMRGPFARRRRRTGRGKALKEALNALEGVRGRYGRSRSRRGGGGGRKAYGDIAGLGGGVLAMALTILILLWLVRRKLASEHVPGTEAPEEEGVVEEAPPEETD
jgi:hypothetical protein